MAKKRVKIVVKQNKSTKRSSKKCNKTAGLLKPGHLKFIEFLLVLIVILLIIIAFGMLINKQQQISNDQNIISQNGEQPVTTPPKILDFESENQGTFRGILNAELLQQPEEELVLFASAKLSGMNIIYYPYQQKLVAGTPEMSAEKILLFDGVQHELAYTFKKGEKQALFYDGKLIAQSEYLPQTKNMLMGMVTGTSEVVVNSGFELIRVKENVDVFS